MESVRLKIKLLQTLTFRATLENGMRPTEMNTPPSNKDLHVLLLSTLSSTLRKSVLRTKVSIRRDKNQLLWEMRNAMEPSVESNFQLSNPEVTTMFLTQITQITPSCTAALNWVPSTLYFCGF